MFRKYNCALRILFTENVIVVYENNLNRLIISFTLFRSLKQRIFNLEAMNSTSLDYDRNISGLHFFNKVDFL